MSAPILWSGNEAKLLKKILNLDDQSKITSGDLDPTSVAVAGDSGDLYISSNGGLYVKQDSGTTTNWIDVTAGSGVAWGAITGTLSNQTDLQIALDTKLVKTSNLSDLTSTPDARANIGALSTAVTSGCAMTGTGTALVQVSAGVGYIVDIALPGTSPTYTKITYAGNSNVTPSYQFTTFYIDNTATLQQFDATNTVFSQEQKRANLFLGSVFFSGGVILAIQNIPSFPTGISGRLDDLGTAVGPLNMSGNLIEANGANLLLDKTSGYSYGLSSNHDNSHNVPDITTNAAVSPIPNANVRYNYRDGVGGFTSVAYTGITPNLWDDNSGTPATITGSRFSIHRVYFFPNTSTYVVYLGQAEYLSLSSATAAINTEVRTISTTTANLGVFLCSIVVRKNTASLLSATDVFFAQSDKFGTGSGSIGTGTTSLQGAYNNSTTPEITTNSTLGAITVVRGSAADSDNIYEGKNAALATTFGVTGAGNVTATSFIGPLTGNASTVTTNANLTGDITSSGNATTLGANYKVMSVGLTIDGGGSAITTGSKGYITVPYNCTINSNTLLADQSGSIVIDIKKSTYSGFPTTSSICASAKPTLSTAQKSTDATLTGWTTTVTAGDVLEFVVDSITTCTRVNLVLKVTKT